MYLLRNRFLLHYTSIGFGPASTGVAVVIDTLDWGR